MQTTAPLPVYAFSELECSEDVELPAIIRDGYAQVTVTHNGTVFEVKFELLRECCDAQSGTKRARLHDNALDLAYDLLWEHSEHC